MNIKLNIKSKVQFIFLISKLFDSSSLHAIINYQDELKTTNKKSFFNSCQLCQYKNYCRNLTDAPITAIAAHCSSLTSLTVMFCDKLTNASNTAIASQCSSLTSLDVSHCDKLTDAYITAIATHCSSLTLLDVFGCHKLMVLLYISNAREIRTTPP